MSAESHPKKTLLQPARFQFQRKQRKTKGAEAVFTFCCGSRFESSLVWLIFPPVLQSSLVIPFQHFGRSTEVTNVFPWKQTCHAIVKAGLSDEIQLCQRGTSWWPDWSHISTTVWLLTTKLLLNCVWVLTVIVRHMHVTVSFGLFVSLLLSIFCHISLFLSLLRFVFYKGSALLGLMTLTS